MLKTINNLKVRDEKGFTLVELLIVIAIIAILAAIAIPQFSEYRKRGIEATMSSDGKNAATAVEAAFADAQSYSFVNGASVSGGSKGIFAITGGSAVSIGASGTNLVTITSDATTYAVTVTNVGARSGKTSYSVTQAGASGFY